MQALGTLQSFSKISPTVSRFFNNLKLDWSSSPIELNNLLIYIVWPTKYPFCISESHSLVRVPRQATCRPNDESAFLSCRLNRPSILHTARVHYRAPPLRE